MPTPLYRTAARAGLPLRTSKKISGVHTFSPLKSSLPRDGDRERAVSKNTGLYRMSSNKTRTRTIRISNECADYFADKPLNKAVEGIYELICDGRIRFAGEKIEIVGVHTEDSEKKSRKREVEDKKDDISPEMRDTIQMLTLYGISFDKFLGMMHESLENGNITIEDDGLKTKDSLDLERLYDVCHERGIDPQEAIDKTVKMIRR